jgi:phage terminase large subunit
MRDLGVNGRIVGDSAEPKSIAELGAYGWQIEGAKKGPDSVRQSINNLKRYKLNVTQRSVNLKKELNSYKWKLNKDGKLDNDPVDYLNHAIDALRYASLNILENPTSGRYAFI